MNTYTDLGGIEGIYVVHAKKGYELHEKRLVEIFEKINFPIEFMTDGDPSCFNQGLLGNYFISSIKNVLSPGVLSCTLNHILCYEKIVQNSNALAIVFENDPFFLGDFVENIRKICKEARTLEPGFIISLENTTLRFPHFKEIKKNKYLYKADVGRCAGAYIIDLQAAKNILEDLKTTKCHTVIDWWHNSFLKRNVTKMYWAHPPIIEQGSHNGLMCSTISSKRKSLIRRIQWVVQKAYKTYIVRFLK